MVGPECKTECERVCCWRSQEPAGTLGPSHDSSGPLQGHLSGLPRIHSLQSWPPAASRGTQPYRCVGCQSSKGPQRPNPSFYRWGSRGWNKDVTCCVSQLFRSASPLMGIASGRCHLPGDRLRRDLICLKAVCLPSSLLEASFLTAHPILFLFHICTHARMCSLGHYGCQEGELGWLPGERATFPGLSLFLVDPLSFPDGASSSAQFRPLTRDR